ncbi:hypothetical protein [Pseudarthrobacter sp. PS3-L1]|uniref:hypothetical protein n=1 Tax=Pseudarthrobacter sp. PS3-L1 TaxID=3046207 RepID=UPI0024B9309C|nr:hypothetical protein [Pseudarthrobacter sp. PS3-L1]MDJ0321718.1 hypothetical protein [Pseudarthrobacter sp. PS3-L1]
MRVEAVFNHRGETELNFMESILGVETPILPALIFHGQPKSLTGDRIAAATILLLGNLVTGHLRVGRPISNSLGVQIRKYLDNDEINLPDGTDIPLAIHTGSVEIVIGPNSLEEVISPSQGDRRRILFRELPTHSSSGRLFTFDKFIVSSNSWLFEVESNYPPSSLGVHLAVPVLMAQDLSASRIDVPNRLLAKCSTDDIRRIAGILNAVDILLSVDGKLIHAN